MDNMDVEMLKSTCWHSCEIRLNCKIFLAVQKWCVFAVETYAFVQIWTDFWGKPSER